MVSFLEDEAVAVAVASPATTTTAAAAAAPTTSTSTSTSTTRASSNRALIAGCVANFGVQYNFTIFAVALLFLSGAGGGDGRWYDAGMWGGQASAVLKSSSFVGACGMGYLGDVLGRDPAFAITSLLMVIFTVVSGCISGGGGGSDDGSGSDEAMGLLLVARFFLGVGIGGCYPLASSKGAEECGHGGALEKNQAVGLIFFWQCIGDLFPYVVGMVVAGLGAAHDAPPRAGQLGHVEEPRTTNFC